MTEVAKYTFPLTSQQVRSILVDGEPWFVGADVASILGYANGSRDINRHVPEHHRGVYRIGTPSGDQQMTVIDEPGAYRLIMRSNQAQAEAFQDWLAEDVIPSIRKTGSYALPAAPMDELELAQRAVELIKEKRAALARAEQAEARAGELEVPARAWAALASAEGDYEVADAAKILARDPDIDIGGGRLFKVLEKLGWAYRRDRAWHAYQSQIGCGRLVQRASTYPHPHSGDPVAYSQVRVTIKGLAALHKHLGGTGDIHRLLAEISATQ